MRKIALYIALTLAVVTPFVLSAHNDDYVDDVYYYPTEEVTVQQVDTLQPLTPKYSRQIKQLIFIDDSDSIR